MKLSISYNKLPNGNIHASIMVTHKEGFPTDKIFPPETLHFTDIDTKPFPAFYDLAELGSSTLYITGPAHVTHKKIPEVLKYLKMALKNWEAIPVPDAQIVNL
jgi:hypothetical protein